MDRIDPEKLKKMGKAALQSLHDRYSANALHLLDEDAAFAPENLSKTRASLRDALLILRELAAEAQRE
jgi:hypothetical protein